ncbi:MAG: hypothetical protein HC880_02090 [Bacteroidia bacterium]|nr:hypothetical protein [Bacteroidia bacterium]
MMVLNLVLALFLSLNGFNEKPEPPIPAVECDAKPYKDKCVGDLPTSYTFLKSYTIDGKDGTKKTVEYSYIFSKETSYLVMLSNGNAQTKGLKVTLFDSNRRQLATSFVNGKYYPAMAYQCRATGIYFIRFTFEDTNNYCAGAVLAFKR